ncbi:uncharacterized protein LOC122506482 [Leptopilina heterotoma]|uniref:uncharacterized protein LOC122506482 n=1 Tax=Leptopilina heterotoma TaxID=63436 RepID=UPI001CA9AB82|nr:uncharacterized protein LOC122506482 [Leptopilina heterotoma]
MILILFQDLKEKLLYSKASLNNLDISEEKQLKKELVREKDSRNKFQLPSSINFDTGFKIGTPDHDGIEAIKITTVVELMRNKTKDRKINKLRSKRETSRSVSIVANPQNLSRKALATTLMRNFYGFPRTTTDEPQNSSDAISNYGLKENINFYETKSVPVPHPYSFLPLPLSAYNDSIATEVEDLNILPPLLRHVKRVKTQPDIPLLETTSPRPFKIKKQRQIVNKPEAPLLKEATNLTYINILDHRKNLLNGSEGGTVPGYPADIPFYNPDIIPYVHVPDYADQREESLDKNDPHSGTKFADYDNPDFVDPTAPVDKEAEAVKGTDKLKVSTQTPQFDIQDYRPAKDTYETDKTEEIPVHETQESEDTSLKQSQDSQTPKESSSSSSSDENKPPFSFKELFKELNLPYNDDDETKEQESLNENKEEDEGSYYGRQTGTKETSSSEHYSSDEKVDNSDREKSSEVGDDDHTNEDAKLIRITDDEFKYGDKDFFKPFFENSGEISSHEYYFNDSDDKEDESS